MGYYVTVDVVNVTIPRSKVKKCREAINAMFEPEKIKNGGGSSNGSPRYSWVDNPPEGGFKTLVDAFKAWRYDAHAEDNGDVVLEYFTGEKLGDDEMLFEVIAPFVKRSKKSVEIRFRGEEGEHWRYVFEKGIMIQQNGKVVYEDV